MREPEFAAHASFDPARLPREGRAPLPSSRAAFVASIVAHLLAGYWVMQHRWVETPAPPRSAEFFLFEMSAPLPSPAAEPAPAAPPQNEDPGPESPPRAAEVVPPALVLVEPAPAGEPAAEPEAEPAPPAAPAPPSIDLDEARQRAAREVVGEGAAESAYMTFSLRDVAPPRPEAPDEPERSIFDGTGSSRGPSVGQLGQSRTKFGHRMASLCNALTGGFSMLGWGSFCAGPRDGGPSGFFPEVRPDYLDSLPECVDTRDTAPALALEAPFPTVKCRLVKQQNAAEQP